MFIKQTDIDKVVDKWISHPDEVKREDLKKPYLNTYFWKTKPKGKFNPVRVLGNFEIFMDLHFGQRSNSGKSKSPNQTVFVIKDLTTNEEWEAGFIVPEYPNRRSRFGSVEKYEREKRDISKSTPENTPSSTKETVKGSVLEFANSLSLSIGLLLDQLSEANINITNEDDLITPEDKDRLLNFLRSNHKKKDND